MIALSAPLCASEIRSDAIPAVPESVAIEQRVVSFWSDAVRLVGNVFKPVGLTAEQKLPGILMIHGWGGNRANVNRAYATYFAELGFIVMTFDLRGWGDSGGFFLVSDAELTANNERPQASNTDLIQTRQIREVVNPQAMLVDTQAALAWFVAEPNLQADNLGIWGTSLGGALAVVAAAQDPRVKALVTQIGPVNSKANFAMIPDAMVQQWESQRARGEIAPFPGPESALPGFRGYPDFIAIKRFDPAAYWESITIPTLIIDAEEEELFDRQINGAAFYRTLAGRVPVDYRVIPGTHYSLYENTGLLAAREAALAWFVHYLK